MITACERVRDLERAYQWSQRMLEFAKRWRIQDLFVVCRAHYGAILVLRGTWEEADATFETALRELRASGPASRLRLWSAARTCGGGARAVRGGVGLFRQVEFHPYA